MANFSSTYPSTRPVFNADFSNAGRLDSRITFSRSDTPPTYAAPSAVHYWSNEKHLSSENLLLQSSTFNTTWASNDVTRTSTASAGPDSSSAAFLVYPSTNSSNARVYQSVTVASGERGVLSVYAKQAGKTILAIVEQIGVGSLEYSYFDLTDGSDSGSSNHTRIATASGNGYYRCSIALTPNASRSGNVYFYVVDAAGSVTATASGTDGIYLFGSQYETLASGGPTAYNATTTQIHREYAPTLKSVATAGQPRFEFSPTDSAAMGLLIEGSSTNLVSYSESLSNQTINNSTLTEGAAVGPDGTLNANLLVPTSTGATGRSVNLDDGDDISHTSGNNYAFSIYAKSAGYNYLQWVGLAYFGSTYCNFDLSNGTVGNKSGSVTGSVESVGNGWYRLTVIAPATTTNNTASKGQWQIVESSTSGRATGFTGNDYSGVLLTMAQCELSSFSSSYIKSDSGSAAGTTRAADSASMDLTQAGFNGGPFTVVSETEGGQGSSPRAFSISDGTGTNRLSVFRNSSTATASTQFSFFEFADGVNHVSSNIGNSSVSNVKLAFSVDTDDLSWVANGGTVSTDTSVVLPKVDKLFIGMNSIGSATSNLNGHCKRVAVYSEALTDTNLQALTS